MKSLNIQIIALCLLGMFFNNLHSQSKLNGVSTGDNPLHFHSGTHPGEYGRAIPAYKAELEKRFFHRLHNGKSPLIKNNFLLNQTFGVPDFEAKQRVEKLFKPYSSSFVDSAIAEDTDGSKRKWAYSFDTNRNVTSEMFKIWMGSQWVNEWQYLYTYDTDGNMTSSLYLVWDGKQWLDSGQLTNTYDTDGNVVSELYQDWDGSQWINQYQSTKLYEKNGNVISILYQNWDDSQWVNDLQIICIYDKNGNRLSQSNQYWDGSQWVNYLQVICIYDVEGNMISQLYQNWDDSQWVNNWLYNYTYDKNGNRISGSFQSWDGGYLVDSSQSTYTYDTSENLIFLIIKKWDGSHLKDGYQYFYNYDIDGNLISKLYQSWNGNQWRNNEQEIYTYDTFAKLLITPFGMILYGNISSYIFQRWYGGKWVKQNDRGLFFQDSNGNYFSFYGAQIAIYYNTVTGIKENDRLISGFSLSQNYPNPFNPLTTIKFQIPEAGTVNLAVFDVTGRIAKTLINKHQPAGKYQVTFDAGNLPSGVYFYRINTTSGFSQTRKMLLVK